MLLLRFQICMSLVLEIGKPQQYAEVLDLLKADQTKAQRIRSIEIPGWNCINLVFGACDMLLSTQIYQHCRALLSYCTHLTDPFWDTATLEKWRVSIKRCIELMDRSTVSFYASTV